MDLTSPSDGRHPEAAAERDGGDSAATGSDTAESDATTAETDTIDPAAVQQAIRTHGERIKQRELQQAMHRLAAETSLTPAEQQVVEEMADSLLDELLATPESVLAAADDEDTLRTVVELFDPTE